MRMVSAAALAMSIMLGSVALGNPANAQNAAAPAMTKDERAALRAAETALEAKNYTAAAPAISTAISTAHTGYVRYLAASLQLKLGMETNNRSLQYSAIQAMIESGAAPASSLEELYKNQGALALASGERKKADAAFGHWVELAPNNPQALIALAEVKDDQGDIPGSVGLIERAIQAQRAAGQTVPESWYKRGLKQAFDKGLAQQSMDFAHGLLASYPTPENWRDALLIYRDLYHPDTMATVDTMRLMRSAKALSGERDYLEYANALDADRNAGERKAVLDEGVAGKMINPAEARYKAMILACDKKAAANRKALAAMQTKAMAAKNGDAALVAGDAYFGYGDYAKAAELYRAALQKGSVDANVANMRLGMALALAGQGGEAQTALRAVTGPRAALASYWLVWLSERGQA